MNYKDILDKGFALINIKKEDEVKEIIIITKEGFILTRDVIITSNKEKNADLHAESSEFWFHTDGVFLEKPPRWMIIKIVHADTGGALQLLDSKLFSNLLENTEFKYGKNDTYIQAYMFTKHLEDLIFRYRKDYMLEIKNGDLDKVNAVIFSQDKNIIDLGELKEGDTLVLDNWRFLHRRLAFNGERTIRRIWIEEK